MFKPFSDEWFTQERINLFRRMVKDAETLDKELGQPDCSDEENAKLANHINELEEQFCEYKGADHD